VTTRQKSSTNLSDEQIDEWPEEFTSSGTHLNTQSNKEPFLNSKPVATSLCRKPFELSSNTLKE